MRSHWRRIVLASHDDCSWMAWRPKNYSRQSNLAQVGVKQVQGPTNRKPSVGNSGQVCIALRGPCFPSKLWPMLKQVGDVLQPAFQALPALAEKYMSSAQTLVEPPAVI